MSILIDAHCHASPLWYEPVESLLFQMDRNGVQKAVLTQLLGEFHNEYQDECVAQHGARFVHVGAVDPADPSAVAQIGYWSDRGMAGLRLRPDARSPGAKSMGLWQAAADRQLAISCAGPTSLFLAEDFAALTAEFSQTIFVLEHLAGWVRPDCDRSSETWARILALARLPNVAIKIAALGQLAPRPPSRPLPKVPPVLDIAEGQRLLAVLDSFGADRLLWSSDFPVVSSREGYRNALQWTRDVFADRPEHEVAAIFGGNAGRIFFSASA